MKKNLFIFLPWNRIFFSNRKYIILNRRWTAFTIIIIHRRRIPRRRHIFFNNKYFFFVSSSFFYTVKPSVTFWKKFFWGNYFVYPFSVCLQKRHYISQKSIWNLFSYWLFNHNWKILLKLSFGGPKNDFWSFLFCISICWEGKKGESKYFSVNMNFSSVYFLKSLTREKMASFWTIFAKIPRRHEISRKRAPVKILFVHFRILRAKQFFLISYTVHFF